MSMPTALIIGASRGLGRALAEEHLKRGWGVIATVRNPASLADIAQDRLQVEVLETTDWAAVDALKAKLAGQKLDLLFVNAAISPEETALPVGDISQDLFEEVMLINVLAPLKIADRLADLTAEDGTIAIMSSRLASIELNVEGYGEAYRISKAAMNMGLKGIAVRRADKRTYMATDPGWVQTDMGGPDAPLTIQESIPGLANVLASHRGKGGIHFVNYAGEKWPW
jgi:NAD(P)-dependent dehydrogenase (short-subunit alcohol dehydrogenase family)